MFRTEEFHSKVMDQTQILVQIYLTAGGEALTRIRSSGRLCYLADGR